MSRFSWINRQILSALVSVVLAVSAGAADRPGSRSARIRATATVINPLGLTPPADRSDSAESADGACWLLRYPRREGLEVQVQLNGESAVGTSTNTQFLVAIEDQLSIESLKKHHSLLYGLPENASSCVVTITYTDQ